MKTNRNAELMLRIYESVIFPGKCQHLSRNEREVFRSVWSYDITYLYPSVYKKNDTDWMEFGLFDSKKVDGWCRSIIYSKKGSCSFQKNVFG